MLFYILAATLIITSILCIVSKKNILSLSLLICFLFTASILFFNLNSFICGVFQFILTLLSAFLLIILYKNLPKQKQRESLLKTKKFWVGVITVITLLLIAGLFVYCYINLSAEENLLIFSNKSVIPHDLSALITVKSVFIDYCLAYFYIMLIFVLTAGGVCLLVKRKRKEGKND